MCFVFSRIERVEIFRHVCSCVVVWVVGGSSLRIDFHSGNMGLRRLEGQYINTVVLLENKRVNFLPA